MHVLSFSLSSFQEQASQDSGPHLLSACTNSHSLQGQFRPGFWPFHPHAPNSCHEDSKNYISLIAIHTPPPFFKLCFYGISYQHGLLAISPMAHLCPLSFFLNFPCNLSWAHPPLPDGYVSEVSRSFVLSPLLLYLCQVSSQATLLNPTLSWRNAC